MIFMEKYWLFRNRLDSAELTHRRELNTPHDMDTTPPDQLNLDQISGSSGQQLLSASSPLHHNTPATSPVSSKVLQHTPVSSQTLATSPFQSPSHSPTSSQLFQLRLIQSPVGSQVLQSTPVHSPISSQVFQKSPTAPDVASSVDLKQQIHQLFTTSTIPQSGSAQAPDDGSSGLKQGFAADIEKMFAAKPRNFHNVRSWQNLKRTQQVRKSGTQSDK